MDREAIRQGRGIARRLVEAVRSDAHPALTDRLMGAYSLTSKEGRALMELAEALLRVPDNATRDALLRDKIPGNNWIAHDQDGLLKIAGFALSAAGMVIRPEHLDTLHSAVSRLGMPIIRKAVLGSMKAFGRHFVMAESIEEALEQAKDDPHTLYSFDMLGEGARTEQDATRYLDAYRHAVEKVGAAANAPDAGSNHGVSVKLSALYPRYETRQEQAVTEVLVPRILELALLARKGNIPLTIDAEEEARLDLSMRIAGLLMHDPRLAGWDGFGMVVQTYLLGAGRVLRSLRTIASKSGQRIAIRLAKGAYWDHEIKVAQEKGLERFPVFTRKEHTDLSYLRVAHDLLQASPLLRPQFATHNAATLGYIEAMANAFGSPRFEVQRLHGMGERLHKAYHEEFNRPLRIYAPVGGHEDLLAYLVRRLLENAANSSFVHRIADASVPVKELTAHPAKAIAAAGERGIVAGAELFGSERRNSRGQDLDSFKILDSLDRRRARYRSRQWTPASKAAGKRPAPSDPEDMLAIPRDRTRKEAVRALERAAAAQQRWMKFGARKRADVLDRIADLYETQDAELYALLAREAGKTLDDAVAEVREAVDFCRYYAARTRRMEAGLEPRGVVLAISPWNFPLAIFTGQVVAALAAGNSVVAKPAEQTPLTATRAVQLIHRSGVPAAVLQLVAGDGGTVGNALASAGIADMAVFTGSTAAARHINRAIAGSAKPEAPLLAETGGINAMIVDSTALPERVVDDIVASAFRSAGQRCSALRALFVQEEIETRLLDMLVGAARMLRLGDPWSRATDIGPAINGDAKREIDAYIDSARERGDLIWQGEAPAQGSFVAPAIIRIRGMEDLTHEVFGPVLHVASYPESRLDDAVASINASGYGLTFGVQSRIRERQERIAQAVNAGNVYTNRNQVGAVVGSQPFGGRGLSGTGPKAGGPLYLGAFTRNIPPSLAAGEARLMPGPEGEENRYTAGPRGRILCCASSRQAARRLAKRAEAAGNSADACTKPPADFSPYQAVMAEKERATELRGILAAGDGPIIPLITDRGGEAWLFEEKHVSTDTTAVGGNLLLLGR